MVGSVAREWCGRLRPREWWAAAPPGMDAQRRPGALYNHPASMLIDVTHTRWGWITRPLAVGGSRAAGSGSADCGFRGPSGRSRSGSRSRWRPAHSVVSVSTSSAASLMKVLSVSSSRAPGEGAGASWLDSSGRGEGGGALRIHAPPSPCLPSAVRSAAALTPVSLDLLALVEHLERGVALDLRARRGLQQQGRGSSGAHPPGKRKRTRMSWHDPAPLGSSHVAAARQGACAAPPAGPGRAAGGRACEKGRGGIARGRGRGGAAVCGPGHPRRRCRTHLCAGCSPRTRWRWCRCPGTRSPAPPRWEPGACSARTTAAGKKQAHGAA